LLLACSEVRLWTQFVGNCWSSSFFIIILSTCHRIRSTRARFALTALNLIIQPRNSADDEHVGSAGDQKNGSNCAFSVPKMIRFDLIVDKTQKLGLASIRMLKCALNILSSLLESAIIFLLFITYALYTIYP